MFSFLLKRVHMKGLAIESAAKLILVIILILIVVAILFSFLLPEIMKQLSIFGIEKIGGK